MVIIIMILIGILIFLLCHLYRVYAQLNEWSAQIEHTDIMSNQRLMTKIQNKTFFRFCRAINQRFHEGQQARIQEKRANNELKYTISSVSHDIRTPLTSASGYLELLFETTDSKKRRQYETVIQHRLKDLEQLLNQLFLYTKLSQKEYSFECNRIQPFSILCEVMADYYDRIIQSGLEPTLSFCEEEIEVWAEPEALRRIFQNLIQNAMLYGSNYLTIEQEHNQIVFRNLVPNKETIDVTRLFERFYKADIARRHSSSGLGLSIVKQLMEKMGGSVTASFQNSELTILLIFAR